MSIKRGEWNHVEAFLGVPGTGKSTKMAKRALELQRLGNAYVIGHDVGWNIPDHIPGRKAPIPTTRSYSIGELANSMRAQPKAFHIYTGFQFGPCDHCKEEERYDECEHCLVNFAISVGERNENPVILLIDEAACVDEVSPNHLSRGMRHLLATRRHKNVAILWTAQSPKFAHYTLLSLSTDMYLFAIFDKKMLARLAEVGLRPEMLDKLPELKDHFCIRVNPRRPRDWEMFGPDDKPIKNLP